MSCQSLCQAFLLVGLPTAFRLTLWKSVVCQGDWENLPPWNWSFFSKVKITSLPGAAILSTGFSIHYPKEKLKIATQRTLQCKLSLKTFPVFFWISCYILFFKLLFLWETEVLLIASLFCVVPLQMICSPSNLTASPVSHRS